MYSTRAGQPAKVAMSGAAPGSAGAGSTRIGGSGRVVRAGSADASASQGGSNGGGSGEGGDGLDGDGHVTVGDAIMDELLTVYFDLAQSSTVRPAGALCVR